MSTSAPAIGRPSTSRNRPSRTGRGPASASARSSRRSRSAASCMRQNGPSRLASVSVCPLLPLLRRQTSVERPSEPDIRIASLWVSLVCWPEGDDVGRRGAQFLLGQPDLAREGVQVAHQGRHDFPEAGVGRPLRTRSAPRSVTSSWRSMITGFAPHARGRAPGCRPRSMPWRLDATTPCAVALAPWRALAPARRSGYMTPQRRPLGRRGLSRLGPSSGRTRGTPETHR